MKPMNFKISLKSNFSYNKQNLYFRKGLRMTIHFENANKDFLIALDSIAKLAGVEFYQS